MNTHTIQQHRVLRSTSDQVDRAHVAIAIWMVINSADGCCVLQESRNLPECPVEAGIPDSP